MFFRSVESMKPSAFADCASFFSDDAIGSSVNVMLLNDAATSEVVSALPVTFSTPCDTSCFGLRGVALDEVDRARESLEQVRDDVGVIGEELRGHHEVRGHELAAAGHSVASSTRILPPSSVELGGVRLGHPRPVDRSGLERGDGGRVVLRHDLHVAAAFGVGLVALRLQPGAQRDVLGVAERRRRQLLALQLRGARDRRLHDEERTAGRDTGDDADRGAVRLLVRVDRGVGSDERGVERAGEECGRLVGARVVGARLQVDVGAEILGERVVLQADDGRRVGDVRQVAEAQRDRAALAAAVRGLRAAPARGGQGQRGDEQRDGADTAAESAHDGFLRGLAISLRPSKR